MREGYAVTRGIRPWAATRYSDKSNPKHGFEPAASLCLLEERSPTSNPIRHNDTVPLLSPASYSRSITVAVAMP